MKQKIAAQDLRIGMFVCELDRPWLETPFLFQGFELRTDQEIRTLQQYCQHVYITPIEHLGSAPRARDAGHTTTRTVSESARHAYGISVEQDLLKITNHPGARATYPDVTTLEEEIERVRDDYRQARELTFSIMEDVRLGKPLDVPGTKQRVAALVESVVRNPDALTCFTQLKKKHEYTAQHSLRVCVLALMFGRQLGFSAERLNVLGLGALLHDIGKMKVPNEILDKPKALTEDETEIMKSHVPRGVEILEGTAGIATEAIEVARCHHERYDGRGYILGMSGDDIGTFGLIGGIVDFYDAITSDRAYHAGISPHSALKIMYEGRGSTFHPTLVEQFIQCLGIYPVGSVVELNSGEIGVVASLNRVRRLKPRVVLVRRRDGTPYPLAPAVNLENRTTPEGRPCEIERVVEPETSGVNPAYFLPVPSFS